MYIFKALGNDKKETDRESVNQPCIASSAEEK